MLLCSNYRSYRFITHFRLLITILNYLKIICRFIMNNLSCHRFIHHFFINSLYRYHFYWLFICDMRNILTCSFNSIKVLNLFRILYILNSFNFLSLKSFYLFRYLLLILILLIFNYFSLIRYFLIPSLRLRLLILNEFGVSLIFWHLNNNKRSCLSCFKN